MGSLQSIIGMLPKIGPLANMHQMADKVDEGQFTRVEAIINSMTAYEREHHEAINGSRRKRIARGSGTSVQEVNNLLRQYAQMRKMFKSMSKPKLRPAHGRNENAGDVSEYHCCFDGDRVMLLEPFPCWCIPKLPRKCHGDRSEAEWSHPLFFSSGNKRWLDFARHDV